MGKVTSMAALAALTLGLACAQASAQPDAPAPPSDVSRRSGSLSEKLNSTDGVIHPEGSVDPSLERVPEASGRMPVVPPPGGKGAAPGPTPK